MKRKIIFVYPEMFMGGSTTSLLSLLNIIDYDIYEVHLLLYNKKGQFIDKIPSDVLVHDDIRSIYGNSKFSQLSKLLYYLFSGYIFKSIFYEFISNKKIGFNSQVLSYALASSQKKLTGSYDVAIGYLELWPNVFTIRNITASKKLLWIHTDYKNAKFISKLDYKIFTKADNIVFVSQECKDSFVQIFPDFSNKCIIIENMILADDIITKATESIHDFEIDKNSVNIVTSCRLTIKTKGLDRIVIALKKLIEEGYNLKWYIIGDGPDRVELEEMILSYHLENNLILLGQQKNPYPYMKKCDVYVMPSRYEGKPMAVTEAQILGLPVIVTNYSSAREQVQDRVDGIIVDNNDHSLYEGIKEILLDPNLLKVYSENIKKRDLSNISEIQKFYNLIL